MFYALDIETIEKPIPPQRFDDLFVVEKEKIDADFEGDMQKASEYKKAETVEKYIELAKEKRAKKTELAEWKILNDWKFSREGAQIVCFCFGQLDKEGAHFGNVYSANEKDVALAIGCLLSTYDGVSPILTYNGDSFDLPHLIRMFAEHDVKLEYPINPRNFVDLMKSPFERFTKTLKMDELCELYKIDIQPQTILDMEADEPLNGSHVRKMFDLDRKDGGRRVAQYCERDVEKTLLLGQRINNLIKL
jgi:hypothetical protein